MIAVNEQLPFMAFAGRTRGLYRRVAKQYGIQSAGWLAFPKEAQALYEMAALSTGPIVEIGTYLGLSTCFLAAAGKNPVYTVDPHNDEHRNPTQLKIIQGVDTVTICQDIWQELMIKDRITLVQATSEEAAEEPLPKRLGMVFIDGDHKPDACSLDITLWKDRIKRGGYLALHDWGVVGDESVKWDVAGCAFALLDPKEWEGPVVCGTVAHFRKK